MAVFLHYDSPLLNFVFNFCVFSKLNSEIHFFGKKYFKIFTVFHRKLKNIYFKLNKSRMVDNVELRIVFLEILKLNSNV